MQNDYKASTTMSVHKMYFYIGKKENNSEASVGASLEKTLMLNQPFYHFFHSPALQFSNYGGKHKTEEEKTWPSLFLKHELLNWSLSTVPWHLAVYIYSPFSSSAMCSKYQSVKVIFCSTASLSIILFYIFMEL